MRYAFVLPESISTVHKTHKHLKALVVTCPCSRTYLCDSVRHLNIDASDFTNFCLNGFTSGLAAFFTIDITKQRGKMLASQDFSAR